MPSLENWGSGLKVLCGMPTLPMYICCMVLLNSQFHLTCCIPAVTELQRELNEQRKDRGASVRDSPLLSELRHQLQAEFDKKVSGY